MKTHDPLAAAVFTDTLGLAGDLAEILAALDGFDTETIKGLLYRKPPGGLGKFEWVEQVQPPFDMANIATSLKTRFGGGDYRLQIFAGGKTRKNIEFAIMSDPNVKPLTPQGGPMGADSLIMLMMNQQAEARREAAERDAEFRREAREYQRQQDERQARRDENLYKMLGIAVPIVAPLLLGNKDKLADTLALIQATRGEQTNLKDTVETFVALKGIMGDSGGGQGGGFDMDDIAGSIGRLAGPALRAAGQAFASGRQGGAAAGHDDAAEAEPLYLPGPEAPAPVATIPPVAAAPAAAPTSPVLAFLRPHILYFYQARHDPALAADAIADMLTRQGVTDAQLHELVAAFTLSQDWKADLAAQGIDLRTNPEWADEFLSELIAAWSDGDGDGERADGRGRGAANPGHDGDAGQGRGELDADSRPGAPAN